MHLINKPDTEYTGQVRFNNFILFSIGQHNRMFVIEDDIWKESVKFAAT